MPRSDESFLVPCRHAVSYQEPWWTCFCDRPHGLEKSICSAIGAQWWLLRCNLFRDGEGRSCAGLALPQRCYMICYADNAIILKLRVARGRPLPLLRPVSSLPQCENWRAGQAPPERRQPGACSGVSVLAPWRLAPRCRSSHPLAPASAVPRRRGRRVGVGWAWQGRGGGEEGEHENLSGTKSERGLDKIDCNHTRKTQFPHFARV